MAICVDVTSEGFLRHSDSAVCESYMMVSSSEYSDLMNHQSVSAQDASMAIGFGFAVVFGLGYLSTYAVGVCKRVIAKL